MRTYEIKAEAGIQTSWDLGRATCPVQMWSGFQGIGLTKLLGPRSRIPKRTRAAALKTSLKELFPYRLPESTCLAAASLLSNLNSKPPHYRIVRALQDKTRNGYGVFLEQRLMSGVNIFTQLCAARVTNEDVVSTVDESGDDMDLAGLIKATELQMKYDFFRSHLGAEEVGEVLSRILESFPYATRLGRRKGRWHIHEEYVPTWVQVSRIVEQANRDPKVESIVEIQPMIFTESSLRSCRKSLGLEIERSCDRVLKELRGGLGKRGATNREMELSQMRNKIDRCSQFLGEFDQDLTSKIQDVEKAISIARAMDDASMQL